MKLSPSNTSQQIYVMAKTAFTNCTYKHRGTKRFQSLVIPNIAHEQGESGALYMKFDEHAFTLALAFLGQANYPHP